MELELWTYLVQGLFFLPAALNTLIWIFRKDKIHALWAVAGYGYAAYYYVTSGYGSSLFSSFHPNTSPFIFLSLWFFLFLLNYLFWQKLWPFHKEDNWIRIACFSASLLFFFMWLMQIAQMFRCQESGYWIFSWYFLVNACLGLRLKRLLMAENKKEDPEPENSLPLLSDKESEIWALLAQGLTDKEIADHICRSIPTVKTYLRSLYKKLNVRNRTEAGILYRFHFENEFAK